MGFAYEYTYQGHEYIIRTMNTKHALTVHLRVFLPQAAHKIGLSRRKFICKNICDHVSQKVGLQLSLLLPSIRILLLSSHLLSGILTRIQ